MLMELMSGDATLANLYFRTILEEAPKMTMLEAALTPEMLDRLRELESFRDYEARVIAEARTKAKAEVTAEVTAEVIAEVIAGNLKDFLVLRGDKPTKHAFKTISASRDADELDAWLKRAFQGESSAQLFPEPETWQPPAS
jgi:hypothetical protein